MVGLPRSAAMAAAPLSYTHSSETPPMKKLPIALSAVAALSASATFAAYDTPEATVAAVREALSAGRLPSLSQLLPGSYQSDLADLASSFAGRMDPDVWNAGRTLLKTAADTFGPKSALLADLVASSAAENGTTLSDADKAQTAASFGALLRGLSAAASSDATSLSALKSGSFASVEKAIGTLFPQGSLDSALLTVSSQGQNDLAKGLTVSSTSTLDNGDVTLTMADDESVTLRKVEGCWIPADLADGWTEFIGEARTAISSIDYTSVEGQQNKMKTLLMLPAIQGAVQQLGTATTADELKTKATMMIGGLIGGMGAGIPGL